MDTKAKTVRFPVPLYQRLRKAAFDREVPQQALITEAVEEYLDRLDEGER